MRWSERAGELDLTLPDEERLASVASTAYLELCQPRAAVRRVLRDGPARFVRGEAGDVVAEALLALDRPIHALRVLLPRGENQEAAQPVSWHRALLTGRAYGMLRRLDSATRVLEQGLRLESGGGRAGAILTSELALVHLRCGGDVRRADYYLRNATQYHVLIGSREWLDVQVARMALERAQDRPDAARETLSRIFAEFSALNSARSQVVRAAVHGLPVAARHDRDQVMRHDRDQVMQTLLDALYNAGNPAATRVGMLRDLRYCPDLNGVEAGTLALLDREVLQPWLEERQGLADTDEDGAWVDLAAVEILRLLGRAADARAMLDRAVAVLAAADPLIRWEWIRAADRIGVIQAGEAEPPPDLLERYGAYPAVLAGYLIDLTARRLPADPAELSRQRLDQAERLLGQAEKQLPAWQSRLGEVRARLDRPTVPTGASRGSSAPGAPLPQPPLQSQPQPGLRPPDARPGERAAALIASDVPWSGPLPDPALIEELRSGWLRWAAANGQVLTRAIGPRLAEAGPPGRPTSG